MVKKLLPFLCSLAPLCAFGTEPMNLGAGEYQNITSGTGSDFSSVSVYNISVLNTNQQQMPETTNGDLYIINTAGNPYAITSTGNISVTNNILVDASRGLQLNGSAGMTVGNSIIANGSFTVTNVTSFSSGAISSGDLLSITSTSGGNIVTGGITSTNGNTTVIADGALQIGGIVASATVSPSNLKTKIGGTSIQSGDVQNLNGKMNIVTTGNFTGTGSVENSGVALTISGDVDDITVKSGNVSIDGTLKNDVTTGTLTIRANYLTVSGSDAINNASFVNSGNAVFDITGLMTLEHGMNLANMVGTSELSIKTGTLNLGTNNIIANDAAALVKIDVLGGSLNAGTISNGTNTNATTEMDLSGVGVAATSVLNYGTLTIGTQTATSADDILITGGLTNTGGTTTITAGNQLEIRGAISNSGIMDLSGNGVSDANGYNSVKLASVSNTGAQLSISALTSGGTLLVTGDITNNGPTNGVTTITSKSMNLQGAVNNQNGKLSIVGSDTAGSAVSIGSIGVSGGQMNLNAWKGGVTTGSLTVSGGVLNLGSSVNNFTSSGSIDVTRNLNLAAFVTSGAGDVYLTATGNNIVTFKSTTGSLTIGGDVIATDNTNWRTAILDVANGSEILVSGTAGVNVQNKGKVVFGSNQNSTLTVENGGLSAINGFISGGANGGIIEIFSGTATATSLTEANSGEFIMHGNSFEATNGNINIADGIWFDGSSTSVGMVIDDALNAFSLTNSKSNTDMIIGNGIAVGDGNTLALTSGRNITISGDTEINGALNASGIVVTFNDGVVTSGSGNPALRVEAKNITLTNGMENNAVTNLIATASEGTITSNAAITNSGTFTSTATSNIVLADFTSTDSATSVTITSNGGNVTTGAFSVEGGIASVTGNVVQMNSLDLDAGVTTVYGKQKYVVTGAANLSGKLVQGANISDVNGTAGVLKLVNTPTVELGSLTIASTTDNDYGLIAKSGNTAYTISGDADFGDGIVIEEGAGANISALTIDSGDVINDGVLTLTTTSATQGVTLGNIINNNSDVDATTLVIDSDGLLSAISLTNNGKSVATITSANMYLTGALETFGMLYQNYGETLLSGDLNITNTNYTISASSVDVGGISQSGSSSMIINTSDLSVGGDIIANNLTIAAVPSDGWGTITVDGNISGGVKIKGLERMTVGGTSGGVYYEFNNDSLLHVAVLPFEPGISTNPDYWATVSLADDNTLGQITHGAGDPENAVVYVNGQFVSTVSDFGSALDGVPLESPQIGINLNTVVDQGSAILLLYAKDGVVEGTTDAMNKLRNIKVNFCNADGTRCFDYFKKPDNVDPSDIRITNSSNIGTEADLPVYLTVRDYYGTGLQDTLYIVFDPRFGGPVKVFDIEPIVERVDDSTDGESAAANGLDKMIAGGLLDAGFYNESPIEAIPSAFQGTNLEELANELYNRVEQYVVDRNGTPLARFSRLVQPRELEQVAGSVALNEHTSFRGLEDHMFDEFIWNRNRNLDKVWFDADFGMFRQNVSDDKIVNGNRFNITAGYDWRNSRTLVLGLAAHISHMSSDNSDSMDLSYMPGEQIDGHNSMNVADTNIGVGAYLMKTLGTKARVYGNAFLDAHLFDLSRKQNYVSDIDGSGTAFSIISEWGLMHDWLNQYIVGNLYARIGYNFGFSITEESAGDDYMQLKSDGYFVLTPGYSLIAQKRIYTSPWFQIRPYASVGIEYDLLGMPDVVQYKFAPAKSYSDYDIEINPLWVNIGAGVELLSASGVQVGLDYRYQYNTDIQMHNIRLSGSYRF